MRTAANPDQMHGWRCCVHALPQRVEDSRGLRFDRPPGLGPGRTRLAAVRLGDNPWLHRPAGPAQYSVDDRVYTLQTGQLCTLPPAALGSGSDLHPPRHGDMLRTSENRGCGTFFLEAVGPLHPRSFFLWSALTEYGYWVHPAASDSPKDYYRFTDSPVMVRWAGLTSSHDDGDPPSVNLEAHPDHAEFLADTESTFPVGRVLAEGDQRALRRRFCARERIMEAATRSLVWYSLCKIPGLTRELSDRIASFVPAMQPQPAPNGGPSLRVGTTLRELEAAETAALPLPFDACPQWRCSLSAAYKNRYRDLLMATEAPPDGSSVATELLACCNASKKDSIDAAVEHMLASGKQRVAVLSQACAGATDLHPADGAIVCAAAKPNGAVRRVCVGQNSRVVLCCFDAIVISDGGIFLKADVASGSGVLKSLRVVVQHTIEEAVVSRDERMLTSQPSQAN